MLVDIPRTDDERAAVEGGGTAVDKLLERLADVPTPDGATPRTLAASRISVNIPLTPAVASSSTGDQRRESD